MRKQVAESSSSASTNSEVIKQLEDRISKMSPKSKGISLKGIEQTKEFQEWAKKMGFTVHDELLLVK